MLYIFSDASFRSADGWGVIAYGIGSSSEGDLDFAGLADSICVQSIREWSNIRCELCSAIAALEAVQAMIPTDSRRTVLLYSDCQAVVGLPSRRVRLERDDFLSARTGLPLHNADLYRKLFVLFDVLQPEIHWMKGHAKTSEDDPIRQAFTAVDRAARRHLRAIPQTS